MPILLDKVPRPCKKIIAEDLMARDLVTLKCVETVENIGKALNNGNHHGFPVLNSRGDCIGLIPRNFIIVLLQKNWFYEQGMDGSRNLNESVEGHRRSNANLINKIN